jgi:signal transduction histidine kinase
VLVLFAIPLIPTAVAVAILRGRLYDIRPFVSRALTWLVLSSLVVLGSALAVAAVDSQLAEHTGTAAVLSACVAVAAAFALPGLRRTMERMVYGARRDPAAVVGAVSKQLDGVGDLDAVADSIRNTLKLPYVAVLVGTEKLAVSGVLGSAPHHLPLRYGGVVVGEIVVEPRPGERRLTSLDEEALSLVAAPLSAALHALLISEELRVSRMMVIVAREEERQRLRHELHDGLGPSLTGIGLAADAAANLVATNPERAASVLVGLRADARETLLEVRRLIDGLRPEAIDRVGLVGALRQRAVQLSHPETESPLVVRVVAPEPLPTLPSVVEVAAFRIATEAMTNVARHSAASLAVVSIEVTDCLVLGVRDDGLHREPWKTGVGLEAMRTRVRELGGTLIAGPGDRGGGVEARLPLSQV